MIGAALGAGLGGWGGYQSAKAERSYFRKVRRQWSEGYEGAIGRSEELTQRAMDSPEFQQLRNYLLSTYGAAESTPTARSYQTALRGAQSARGMYFSGGADESRRVAGLAEMTRMNLLPHLQDLVGFGERYRQSIFPLLAEQYTRSATKGQAGAGGIGMFQGADTTSALLAGAVQGYAFGNQVDQMALGMGGQGGGGGGGGDGGGMGQFIGDLLSSLRSGASSSAAAK